MKSLPFISIDFGYDKIHQCAKEHLQLAFPPPKIQANWLAVILVWDGSAEYLTLRVIGERTQLLRPENAKCCINS